MYRFRSTVAVRYLALLLASSVNSPVVAQQDPPAATLVQTGRENWISFEWHGDGHIVVPLSVDGASALALIDTGFPDYALSRRFALAHQIPVAATGASEYDVGGAQQIGIASSVSVELNGFHQPARAMRVLDLSHADDAVGRPIDLIIGAAALARMSLEVDFDHHRLRMRSSGSAWLGGDVVPLEYDQRNGRITLAATIGGRMVSPILLDTGAQSELTLGAASFEALRANIPTITDQVTYGAGGLVVRQLFALHGLHLGEHLTADVIADAETGQDFLAHTGVAGSLNVGFLSRYNFQLDVAQGKLVLRPRAQPDPPTPRSTTGVQWTRDGSQITIIHIMKGSPGQVVGLREGDRICAVDGQAVDGSWDRLPMHRWGSVAPGIHYTIKLCDGRSIGLTTASFF